MLGIVIYLIIQIALAGFTLHVVVNHEEIRTKHANRKDKTWEKIVIVVLIPLMGFAYSLLGGYPPKSDQLVFITIFTAGMYAAMILRWRRQARIGGGLRRSNLSRDATITALLMAKACAVLTPKQSSRFSRAWV